PGHPGAPPHEPMRQNLQTLTENLILQRYAPATVLVDELGNILHVSGRTGRYLEPAAGKANWNLFAMAREGLRLEIDRCFTKAMSQPGMATAPGLCVSEDGSHNYVDLGVDRLAGPEPLAGMLLVLFRSAPPSQSEAADTSGEKAGKTVQRRTKMELALETAREELRVYREEMHRYREDLRGANEELQSSNEEMNSLNEELQTVNAELLGKLDERSHEIEERDQKDSS
ncbi:MAG: chemotaxis protein CheB, partial [Kiritimatiellae bacterium]|nr:chemotaxis protein CheB [Kiritimatiellia bacterium]